MSTTEDRKNSNIKKGEGYKVNTGVKRQKEGLIYIKIIRKEEGRLKTSELKNEVKGRIME